MERGNDAGKRSQKAVVSCWLTVVRAKPVRQGRGSTVGHPNPRDRKRLSASLQTGLLRQTNPISGREERMINVVPVRSYKERGKGLAPEKRSQLAVAKTG